MINRFLFWSWSATAVTVTLEVALGSPLQWYALGGHTLFLTGLVIGRHVVERT